VQQIARVLEGRALTIDEIAEKTGIARSSIQVRLKELREEGRLISGDIHGVRCYTLSDDA
jgi:DNA-binding transcriptional regulator GbsR (MarR family)